MLSGRRNVPARRIRWVSDVGAKAQMGHAAGASLRRVPAPAPHAPPGGAWIGRSLSCRPLRIEDAGTTEAGRRLPEGKEARIIVGVSIVECRLNARPIDNLQSTIVNPLVLPCTSPHPCAIKTGPTPPHAVSDPAENHCAPDVSRCSRYKPSFSALSTGTGGFPPLSILLLPRPGVACQEQIQKQIALPASSDNHFFAAK